MELNDGERLDSIVGWFNWKLLTDDVQIADLILHRICVDLTHVPSLIGFLYVLYPEHPCSILHMRHGHAMILGDDVRLDWEDCLCVDFQPRNLSTEHNEEGSEWYQTANQADLINLLPLKTAKPINISTQIFVDRRWLSGDYECHIYGGFVCTKWANVACDPIASWFEQQLNCAMLQGNRSGWVNVVEVCYWGWIISIITIQNYF